MKAKSQYQIDAVRDQIINQALTVGCLVAIAIYSLDFFASFQRDLNVSHIRDLLVVGGISAITIWRKSLTMRFKSYAILLYIFLIVTVDIYSVGISSSSKVLLIVIPFFAVISLSTKRAIINFMLIIALMIGTIIFLHHTGVVYSAALSQTNTVDWVTNLMLLLLVSSVIWLIISRFNGIYEGFIHDLSDRNEKLKLNRKRLALYRDELETTVEQRTEELNKTNQKLKRQASRLKKTVHKLNNAKEELVQAEKMAALGSLTAGIAHELNNPLNFIMGGVEAMDMYVAEHLSATQQEEVAKLIHGMREGVRRSSKIIDSLGQYESAIEKVESCDINEILNNCVQMVKNQIKGRIDIEKQLEKKLPEIIGEKAEFYQLFLNIIHNSIDAIVDKGQVSISTYSDTNTIHICIGDTGVGIPKKLLNRLSDPFYTTKKVGQGTGLGLYICSKIIRKNSGTIRFVSEETKGTQVDISFPIAS